MTVRYARIFAENSSFVSFRKVIFSWTGSVYKFVWREYLVFITLFFSVSFVYRFVLNEDEKRYFEKLANFCERSKEGFRLVFILGFFVTSIVSKWFSMYDLIPYPDSIAQLVYTTFRENDEETKKLKKEVIRLSSLSVLLTFRAISKNFRQNFKDERMKKLRILTQYEMDELKKMKDMAREVKRGKKTMGKNGEPVKDENEEKTKEHNYWLPILWAIDVLVEANEKREKKIDCSKIFDQLDKLRSGCALLIDYEHNSMPMAYVQMVVIAVYAYFFSCLFGSQWLERNSKLMDIDLYFPIVTTFEFMFYVGWLKLAGSMINPFGGDDDDFDLDEIINRIYRVSRFIRKEYRNKVPDVSNDDNVNADNDNETEVSHSFNNETGSHCITVDPERIPLASLPERR